MNEKDFKSKFDDVMDASDHYIVIKDGKEAIFDKNFEMINSDWFEYIFKIGKVFIFCKNNKYGLLNEFGKVVVEAQYDKIDNFSSNFGELATCKNGKWGMIDDNGEVLIDFKYKSIYTNSMHNLVIAQNFDEKFGLITTDNKVILDFIYDDISSEWDDDFEVQAYVATLNGKHTIYSEGSFLVKYDKILPFYNTNYTIAFLNGKTGLINLDGESLTEFIYDDLSEYYYDKESKECIWFAEQEKFCIMRLNNKWGALDNKGEVIIDFKYDDEIEIRKTCNSPNFIVRFSEQKFALYDENFKQLTSEEYSYIGEIRHKDRFYFSQNDGSKGIMNEKGNVLFKSDSDDKIKFWLGYDSNDHGLLIQKDNLWGFLDFDGNLKIDFIYEKLHSTRLELLIAKSKNGKMGVITDNNEIILDFKYDKILYCDNGKDEYFITTLDGKDEFYNSKGKQIL